MHSSRMHTTHFGGWHYMFSIGGVHQKALTEGQYQKVTFPEGQHPLWKSDLLILTFWLKVAFGYGFLVYP